MIDLADLAGPSPARPDAPLWHVEFDANHMLERCRLFLIIALGESVLSLEPPSPTLPGPADGGNRHLCLGDDRRAVGAAFAASGRLMDRYVDTTTDPILLLAGP